jgi:hypothetical protein
LGKKFWLYVNAQKVWYFHSIIIRATFCEFLGVVTRSLRGVFIQSMVMSKAAAAAAQNDLPGFWDPY